ncbi:hypothetical protein LZ31DRAFT_112657 [Colletotrichum somersetense]|nr:hypothetical protein LZ31DRAFT_112657 [Colletotrichum somersetense]
MTPQNKTMALQINVRSPRKPRPSWMHSELVLSPRHRQRTRWRIHIMRGTTLRACVKATRQVSGSSVPNCRS